MSHSLLVQANIFAREGKIYQVKLFPKDIGDFTWNLEGDQTIYSILEQWMDSYLSKKAPLVHLPLDWKPLTAFTVRVLKSMMEIPLGEKVSYKDLARMAGSPQGARAVGQVCHRNPFPLFAPCHRVIAADGSIGGFSLDMSIKERLLEHERK